MPTNRKRRARRRRGRRKSIERGLPDNISRAARIDLLAIQELLLQGLLRFRDDPDYWKNLILRRPYSAARTAHVVSESVRGYHDPPSLVAQMVEVEVGTKLTRWVGPRPERPRDD